MEAALGVGTLVLVGAVAVAVSGLKCWARCGKPAPLVDTHPQHEGATRRSFDEHGSALPLRVLTLNAYLRPWGISEAHGDCKLQRLRALTTPDVLGKFDLVVLQEAFATGSSFAGELVKAGRDLGLYHHVWPPPPPFWSRQLIDSGLLVLSSLPVVRSGSMRFKRSAYSDSFASKAVLHAALRLDCTPLSSSEPGERLLHVFCVHLQSFYSRVDEQAREVQEAQLAEMMRWIDQRAPPGGPDDAILCGDLNIDARDPGLYEMVRKHILSAGFVDVMGDPAVGEPRPATCHVTYDPRNGREIGTHRRSRENLAESGYVEHPVALDYIFVRRAKGRPLVVEPVQTSEGGAVGQPTRAAGQLDGADDDIMRECQEELRVSGVTVLPFKAPYIKMGALSDHAGVRCDLSWESGVVASSEQ